MVGKVDYVIMDGMNYKHADWVYQKYNLLDKKSDTYFELTERILTSSFSKLGISKRYGWLFITSRKFYCGKNNKKIPE